MNVTFYLRREKKSKRTGMIPVAVMVTENGMVIRKNVPGVKVLEKHWHEGTMRIKPNLKSEEDNDSEALNIILDDISSRLNEVRKRYLLLQKPLSQEIIIKAIENKLNESEGLAQRKILPCFDEFIEINKSSKAERTIKGYVTARNALRDFIELTRTDYTLDEIDLQFFDRFKDFCFQHKQYLNNTFSKVVSNIKTFMLWAEDRAYHSNPSFRKFKAPSEDIEVIYLTMNELMKLLNYEFESVKHDRVRDIYLFACFSGLRYSDLANLKPSNIYEDYLKLTIRKTRAQDHVVPLNQFAKGILDKYKGSFHEPLPVITSQKLNKYIQEACKIAGIDTPINITRFSGSRRIDTTVPKYSKITIHTARKTFVTNSLILGMNQLIVKEITGHRTDRSFKKYYKIADQVKQAEMQVWDKLVDHDK